MIDRWNHKRKIKFKDEGLKYKKQEIEMANTKLIISHFGSRVDFVIFLSFYNKTERKTCHKMKNEK
jgi:hypothetical protein